ncbi:MAG TPA: helix-turn-helix domain-containing protein [Gemmatimonadaceae bacterium]
MASLTLDWLHLIALLGAVQGLFLTGALATRRRNRTANRLLAVLMFAFSVYLASAVYHAAGLEARYPHFFGAGYPTPLLFGPLVYLYAISAADRTRRITRRDLLHLVPFVAFMVAALPIYLMSGPEKLAFYQRLLRGELPPLIRITDSLKLLSGTVYTVATLAFLQRHRERIKASYSSTERVNLRWLLWLGLGAALIWAMALAFEVLETSGMMRIERREDVITLAIAILVYGIGYMGLRQPEIFRYDTAEYPVPPARDHGAAREQLRIGEAGSGRTSVGHPEPQARDLLTLPRAEPRDIRREGEAAVLSPDASAARSEPIPVPEPQLAEPRYQRSGLTAQEAEQLKERLLLLMEREHPWRNSELTLADLAAMLSTTPHKLSEVLNAQLGQTFYDFVNGYRVREVQRRIAAGDARRIKMLAIALDAGFASKSTFNAAFKKHTNRTPSAYQRMADTRPASMPASPP